MKKQSKEKSLFVWLANPKTYFVSCLVLLMQYVTQAQVLTSSARVSLITVSPGDELYSSYGHSAIRVLDAVQGIDKVYSWGVFDFTEPNFYTNFLRGKLRYLCAPDRIDYILYGASLEDRAVQESTLNLSQTQKQRLFEIVQANLLPENRHYQYDFFYDNCATRIRDVLQKTCGDSLRFVPTDANLTFRQQLQAAMPRKPWVSMGMNMVLGASTDVLVSDAQEMFLPNNLCDAFLNAKLIDRPLVEQTNDLRTETNPRPKSYDPSAALCLMALAVAVGVLTWWQVQNKVQNWWFDRLFFGLAGLAGSLILFLWLGTDHQTTRPNWNIAWLVPSHLVVVFWLKKTPPNWLKQYFKINFWLAAAAASVFAGVYFSQTTALQGVDLLFFPLLAVILTRSYFIFKPAHV